MECLEAIQTCRTLVRKDLGQRELYPQALARLGWAEKTQMPEDLVDKPLRSTVEALTPWLQDPEQSFRKLVRAFPEQIARWRQGEDLVVYVTCGDLGPEEDTPFGPQAYALPLDHYYCLGLYFILSQADCAPWSYWPRRRRLEWYCHSLQSPRPGSDRLQELFGI